MSDLHKRIVTGIVATICLFAILEFYLLTIVTIFTVVYISSEEYFAIVNNSFKKNLDKNILENFRIKPIGIYVIPLYFLFSDFIGNSEALISMSLVFAVIACVIERLYQYSSFCLKSNKKDTATDYLFTCFVVIMNDVFFCVYIVFPVSFLVLIAGLP